MEVVLISGDKMPDKTCGTCKYWNSYAAIYFDDLEPHDCGECHEGEYPYPSEKCGISFDNDACENWEQE